MDVGCGRGALLSYIKKYLKKANLSGIDIASPGNNIDSSIKFSKTSLNSFKSDVLYDVIISTAVIEHIVNLKLFLFNIKKNLQKNGTLIIVTNDTSTPLYLTARILKNFGISSSIKDSIIHII